jgi:hypothetical protein
MSAIHVEVRDEPSKLAELARQVPAALRRRPIWTALWQAALAFVPSPLLLLAFSLPTVAIVWTGLATLIGLILFAVEQEVPKSGLTPARITVDERGVTIEREQQTEHWRGAAIRHVHELADAIVLLSHRDGWLVIPHASFDSPATRERFVAAVRAHLQADVRTLGWPKRPPLHFGVIAFLLACAGGLGFLAWDAVPWQRMVCAPLAGVCIVLATADMSSSSRLAARRPGRPTPPRPGSTDDAYLAAVRIEQLRPSALLVLGVYMLAAALLYVTLAAGMIGTAIFVSLALLVLVFATFELSNVFEMWWPWRGVRWWRQIEVGSRGVTRRHAGASVMVPWAMLAEPIVRDGAVTLNWQGGGSFESIPDGAFAQPEDRDRFITVARTNTTG